jgi:hypothetical protein
MADRVCRVLSDPIASAGMGRRLRERLLREHSLEAVVPMYREAYERTLTRSG